MSIFKTMHAWKSDQLDADVIVGAVFVGMFGHGFKPDQLRRWDVDCADAEVDRRKNAEQVRAVLEAVARLAGVDPGLIQVGLTPAFGNSRQDMAIHAHRPDHYGEQAPPMSDALWAQIQALVAPPSTLLERKVNSEYGAYYGVLDAARPGQPPHGPGSGKFISSVRTLVPYPGSGRWQRGYPYHGLIGYDQNGFRAERAGDENKQAGSLEPTGLISQWDGADQVCGYCHGMVFAVAEMEITAGGHGVAYELPLGSKTKKRSSCLGCTTFLLAHGYQPSSVHLGRSDSWLPLPENPLMIEAFLAGCHADGQQAQYKALNRLWGARVAGWMQAGVKSVLAAGPAAVPVAVRARLMLLGAHVEALLRQQREMAVAGLLLDAFTVHDKDLSRLQRFLGLQA